MICLVSEPTHLRIEKAINSFHLEAMKNPPDRAIAMDQHRGLVAALEGLGVEVIKVPAVPEAPYQVFMRDVLIGGLGTPILGRMREPIRQCEIEVLVRTLEDSSIPYVESGGGYLEGGDVVVSGSDAFVGVGDRTERAAADWLAERDPSRRIQALEMEPGFLHLDMVFNVLSPESCVYCPAAFKAEAAAVIRGHFRNRLEIDRVDQRRMSTNFLPVGDAAAIASTTAAPAVLAAARDAGREVVSVALEEIQKAGGSVRCSTCLLEG